MKRKYLKLINFLVVILIITTNLYSEDKFPEEEWREIGTIENVEMKIVANIIVPLQIITDLDVKATVVDNQKLEIPFKLEMNKDPKKTYKLSYTEKLIDMDNDGRIDVQIISPEYSSNRVIEKNKIVIYGEGIKDDGIYRKIIYMTVELKDGI
ncbi:MAG: hypothetical protein ACRC0R_08070 [Cetobacterium sp.]